MPSREKAKKDYDSEPVTYCSKCYSLKVKYVEALGFECCMDCGCSDVLTSSITRWEELYERRYGKKYVEKNTDPKSSFIFKLPIDKLKKRVYENPLWNKIVHTLYPSFPKGLGKTDSIILFFDKLIKDNKLNDLRLLLYQKY